jgi:hypothetical protein
VTQVSVEGRGTRKCEATIIGVSTRIDGKAAMFFFNKGKAAMCDCTFLV